MKTIFWCNSSEGYIGTAKADGSIKDESFIHTYGSPNGITIDKKNKKLLWTSLVKDWISRAADGRELSLLLLRSRQPVSYWKLEKL